MESKIKLRLDASAVGAGKHGVGVLTIRGISSGPEGPNPVSTVLARIHSEMLVVVSDEQD